MVIINKFYEEKSILLEVLQRAGVEWKPRRNIIKEENLGDAA